MKKPQYCFADMVIVEGDLIGVIVKSWNPLTGPNAHKGPYHEVYVRSHNCIKEYYETEMERYMVRHKELSEEELEWQHNY